MANTAKNNDEAEMSSPYTRSQNQRCYFISCSGHVTLSPPLAQGGLAITGLQNEYCDTVDPLVI
jgi:hypothetical protein